ncbi:MAG: LamG domain-containing protein [Lentisphaeria bacterium]|nr:LamG domain-containing protein [Lentisphaeria bacterium]MBQ7206737.1 LamG domain-containing protein [Lentisphaeria bacterium]
MWKKVICTAAMLNAMVLVAAPEAVAELPLDEGDFAKIADVSAGKNQVQVLNREFLKWTQGPQGQALEFNNADGKSKRGAVRVKMPPALDITAGWSLSCVFKTGKDFVKKRIYPLMYFADGPAKKPGIFVFCSWNTIWTRCGTNGAHTDIRSKSSAESIKADTWYRLVVTFDGKTVRVYQNGKLAAAGEAVLQKPRTALLKIGSTGDGYGYGWNGVISQVKVFNRVLTAEEVTALQQED